MYMVTIQQQERIHTVGLFQQLEEAEAWIESIPYVHKQVEPFDDVTFVNYTMRYEDIPRYEEIIWKSSRFPLTHFMFSPDEGPIECFISSQLPVIGEAQGLVEGMTQVDAYMVPNEEAKKYIEIREEIRQALIEHYTKLGKKVENGGIGSEDGEYLIVEEGPFIHLDAGTVQSWENKTSIDQFIAELEA